MALEIFYGSKTKTKTPTVTVPMVKPRGKLSIFYGTSSPPTTQTTTPVKEPIINKPTTHQFPATLGGGEFNLPANKLTTSTRSQEPLGPTKKGAERDHIVPVALGGTSNKINLQYLEDNKSWVDKLLGKKTTFAQRQGGKVVVEQQLIKDFKEGKISLADARGQILKKQREIQGLDPKQGLAPYLLPGLKETVQEGGGKVKDIFTGVAKKAKEAIDNDLTPGFDPALRDQLVKRGEFDKLQKLEQEYLDTHGQKGFFAPNRRPVQETELDIKQKENRKQALEFGGSILQAPQRAITSVAGEAVAGIESLFTGKDKGFTYEPKTKFEKVVFGKEPIKGVFTKLDSAQKYVQTALEKAGIDPDSARGQSFAIAPLFIAGSIGLDLTPFGGEKNTATLVAKSKSADEIFNLIKPLLKSHADDEIVDIARQLTTVNRPEAVKNALLRNISTKAEEAREIQKYQLAEINGAKSDMQKFGDLDFPGQQQANYERFAEIVRDPKLLSPRAKEIIQSGDVTAFKKLTQNVKGYDPRAEDIFGYTDKSDDEIFDMFRERLKKENPNLLGRVAGEKQIIKPPKIDNELPFENVARQPRQNTTLINGAPADLSKEYRQVPALNSENPLASRNEGLLNKKNIQPPPQRSVKQGIDDLSSKIKSRGMTKSRNIDKVSSVSYTDTITKPVISQGEAKMGTVISDLNDTSHGTAEKFITPPNILEKADKFKDISGFKAQARDVYRNFKHVFGDKYPEIKKTLLDPFDAAKGRYIDYQKKVLDEMDQKIVKGFGIKKGSKESAAVMDYGEGALKEGELLSSFGVEKGKKIKQAAEWFREKYDALLEEVNAVRKEIYPNSPDKVIPKRKDYFRHFEELSTGLGALKNIFENPAGISPTLTGVSEFTTPRSKWLSFAQRRVLKDSTRDAVGGFLNYVPSASYAVNIDPFIGQFRKLGRELAEKTDKSRNINNFIEFLHDYSNDLSGKTNAADRFVQKVIPGGRKAFATINWLNNRIKANAILGNLSSAVSQIFNVPQGIASAKQYSIPGATKTLAQIFQPNDAMRLSSFIKERYSSSLYNKFDTGILANTKKFAAWLVGALDEVGTKFIWNSHYEKGIAEKVANPVKYADDVTRSLVAGRGIGEVPLIQKSKLFQFAAPFQLEVGNLWYVMGDMVKKKDFGALATLFVANYLMNRVAEKVRGSDVTFDPINALIQGFKNQAKDEGVLGKSVKILGRLGGEILSNVPLGQTVAGLYPEAGIKMPGVGKMTRSELFGEGDPTRTGSGLLTTQGLSDPLFKLVPGFAGGQLKKTYQGTKALIEGEQKSKSGKPLFDIALTAENIARAPVFGPYATAEGQDYSKAMDEMNSLEAAKTRKAQVETDRIRPIYEKSLALYQAGKKDEATQVWNQLTDDEKVVFKKIKESDKRAKDLQAETKILPLVKHLYDLREQGREEEALKVWEQLTDEEKAAFKRAKKKAGY